MSRRYSKDEAAAIGAKSRNAGSRPLPRKSVSQIMAERAKQRDEGVTPEPLGKSYKHGAYTLYGRDVALKNGNGTHRVYFFAKGTPASGKPCSLPKERQVGVNSRTGLPYLSKKSSSQENAMARYAKDN